MVYSLVWCPELAMFRLTLPTGTRQTKTKEEMVTTCQSNQTLLAWVAMAENNPNTPVDFDMLPK